MNIINLTPHDIVILGYDNKELIRIKSSGVARCDKKTICIDTINGIPVNSVSYGNIKSLPETQTNTIYIVSIIIATAVKNLRDDCYIVDDVARDSSNNIIGCRALSKL